MGRSNRTKQVKIQKDNRHGSWMGHVIKIKLEPLLRTT